MVDMLKWKAEVVERTTSVAERKALHGSKMVNELVLQIIFVCSGLNPL